MAKVFTHLYAGWGSMLAINRTLYLPTRKALYLAPIPAHGSNYQEQSEPVQTIQFDPAMAGRCRKQIYWADRGLILLLAKNGLYIVDRKANALASVIVFATHNLAEGSDMVLKESECTLYVGGTTTEPSDGKKLPAILILQSFVPGDSPQAKLHVPAKEEGKVAQVWMPGDHLFFNFHRQFAANSVLYLWDGDKGSYMMQTSVGAAVIDAPAARGAGREVLAAGKDEVAVFDTQGKRKSSYLLQGEAWDLCIGYDGHLFVGVNARHCSPPRRDVHEIDRRTGSKLRMVSVCNYADYHKEKYFFARMWNGWMTCLFGNTIRMLTRERKTGHSKLKVNMHNFDRWKNHVILPDGRMLLQTRYGLAILEMVGKPSITISE